MPQTRRRLLTYQLTSQNLFRSWSSMKPLFRRGPTSWWLKWCACCWRRTTSLSSRTVHTVFAPNGGATPLCERWPGPGPGPPGSSRVISPGATTGGARSGARRLGCGQPMSMMEVCIPYLSCPGTCMCQGAQVTKHISPVRIGQPGGGHAAAVREIAVPRGGRSKDNGSG